MKALLTGMLTGLLLGLLFAPRPGPETLERLAEKRDKLDSLLGRGLPPE